MKQQGLCWRFQKLPSGEVNEPWWTTCWKRWETAHQISKSLEISSPNGLLGMFPAPKPDHGRRCGPRGGGPPLVNLRLLRFSRKLGFQALLKKGKSLLAPFHNGSCPGHHSSLNFVALKIPDTKQLASTDSSLRVTLCYRVGWGGTGWHGPGWCGPGWHGMGWNGMQI